MEKYYIVSNNGIFKQYYSKTNEDGSVLYTPSPRNAKTFTTIEEAKSIIVELNLIGCNVINQNGEVID